VTPSFDWTIGLQFAYKVMNSPQGVQATRRKTMASKKSLKKAKPLKHTKPLSMTGKHVCI